DIQDVGVAAGRRRSRRHTTLHTESIRVRRIRPPRWAAATDQREIGRRLMSKRLLPIAVTAFLGSVLSLPFCANGQTSNLNGAEALAGLTGADPAACQQLLLDLTGADPSTLLEGLTPSEATELLELIA